MVVTKEKNLQCSKEENKMKSSPKEEVEQLSRMPSVCPVSKCSDIIFPSNMMMHLLHRHSSAREKTTVEAYEHSPILLCFDPTNLKYGENHCVATIVFGGTKGKPETQPAINHLSLANIGLINNEHKYDSYLPIMMMACRSSWYAHLKDKQLERQLTMTHGRRAGVFIFWLVAPNTTRKLYYTLTAFDRTYHISRSVLRTVRDYTTSQNPSEFLAHDDNYFLLRDMEVRELMSVGKSPLTPLDENVKTGLQFELILHEQPLQPDQPSEQVPKEVQSSNTRAEQAKAKTPRTKAAVDRSLTGKLLLNRKPRSKVAIGGSAKGKAT